MTADATLFVGIGSPHGDDQVGWLVVDELGKYVEDRECRGRQSRHWHCRRAQVPEQLLDWLDGVKRLVVCDAVAANLPAGDVSVWDWPTSAIASVRFRGTHELSLPAALELADALGQLPACVRIWGVQIASATPNEPVSSAIASRIPEIARRIYEDSIDA